MNDTISRQAAIDVAIQSIMDWDGMFIQDANCRIRDAINELPSVEPPYQYSEAYVKQVRAERDYLQEVVNDMAEMARDTDRSEGTRSMKNDLICRQAALDALGEAPKVWTDSPEEFAALSQWEMDVTAIKALPSAEPKTDDESELKFYYVESVDDYWVGRRLDNFYYANWHEGLGFVWSHSRYLPWGEHIVDENTLWKEHTYPSEPIEIPFTEWIVGFYKKYLSEPKTGRCETCKRNADNGGFYDDGRTRCPIQEHYVLLKDGYCHLYEPRMRGEEE